MIPLPVEFQLQIEKMLKEEAPAFFASLEKAPALALRLNPARPAARAAAERYIESRVPWAEDGFYLKSGARAGAGVAHAAGAFYLQEASAMVSAAILRPAAGERILDLCAAPGGKSTQIAAQLKGEGLLVSNEPEPARAKVLAANLERMGVRNAAVVNAYPDALAARWSGYFDAVLCDAPCSGEGMFRRDPQTRLQWRAASPAGCAKRQAEILDRAAELVRDGGRLVYSTCTFNREENEGSVLGFLSRHPDFTPEDFELSGLSRSEHGMIRVWPHHARGDGHFAALLRKRGEAKAPVPPIFRTDKEDIQRIDQLEAEVCTLPSMLRKRLLSFGEYLYAVPEHCPDTNGIRIVSAGTRLLRVGRGYIEPEHALAMAVDIDMVRRRMPLNDGQAVRYLAGEALPWDGEKGWTLITWNDLPLGWGKASNGMMKNHLPKGLRLNLHKAV